MSEKGFHIPSLDGLRAIAVMLVFTSHAGFGDIVPGGLGVTIFFFLSGFLITTLMRREYENTGRVSFSKFYLRRVYRIFPPFYLVLALVVTLSLLGVLPSDMHLGALWLQALQMTNYYVIFGNPDFTAPGLTVLWSLSVEEHFYLVFPLLFSVLAARFSASRMAGFFALICAVVLLWRLTLVMGFHVPEVRTYYATDTRIDSIMFGAILAMWHNPVRNPNLVKSNIMVLALLAASGAILLFCLLYRDPVFRETWRYSLQGLALFPVFYFAVTKYQWPLFSWLNWAWVRYIGKVSYTAYLIHPTAITLSNKVFGEGPIPTFIGGLALTLVFSSLMYLLVERRMSALRARLHQQPKP